ncbi:MAG TPA: transglycosylase domain-containing protein, partial [Chitinophagaceae bacterium]|nr:transglycosylase domain-containing protein [Chitinophagaceae bacterium]
MKKSVKIVWQITFGGIVAFVLFILLCSWGAFGKMPDLEDIQNPSASLSSQVYAQDGSIMGKYYLQDRINIQFKNIAQPVLDAVIATEDERFYTHSGI